jgi:pimeloyl-ACP methyl ester carboxylesterase
VVSIDTQGVGGTIVVRLWPNERFSPQAAAMYERRRAEMEALKEHHRGDYASDVNIAARNVAYHRQTLTPEQRALTRPAARVVESFAAAVGAAPQPISDEGTFIQCPVLVIHTGRGKLGPGDITQAWIEENIQARDVQYEVIREASHWPWLEQPAWFLALVSSFLARCSG